MDLVCVVLKFKESKRSCLFSVVINFASSQAMTISWKVTSDADTASLTLPILFCRALAGPISVGCTIGGGNPCMVGGEDRAGRSNPCMVGGEDRVGWGDPCMVGGEDRADWGDPCMVQWALICNIHVYLYSWTKGH